MGKVPAWFNQEPTTRGRSKKQETKIAKDLKGRTTINSGATFGENDVVTDFCEVEAKTTAHRSFPFKVDDWNKLESKSEVGKLPIFVVTFEKDKLDLAVMKYDDLLYLIKKANS